MTRWGTLLLAFGLVLGHGSFANAQIDLDAEAEEADEEDFDRDDYEYDEEEREDFEEAGVDQEEDEELVETEDQTKLLSEAEEGKLAVFELDRGFYLSSDLGFFFAFGGLRGFSNLQPYMAIKAGYDFTDWIGAEINVSTGFVANNPPSEADRPGGSTTTGLLGGEVANYSTFNLTGQVVFALRPTERIAIEPKVGGGISFFNPGLTRGDVPVTQQGPFVDSAPHIAFGADIKYLTLLTDFTAGLSVNGYLILPSSGIDPIFALGPAFVVRYTF